MFPASRTGNPWDRIPFEVDRARVTISLTCFLPITSGWRPKHLHPQGRFLPKYDREFLGKLVLSVDTNGGVCGNIPQSNSDNPAVFPDKFVLSNVLAVDLHATEKYRCGFIASQAIARGIYVFVHAQSEFGIFATVLTFHMNSAAVGTVGKGGCLKERP